MPQLRIAVVASLAFGLAPLPLLADIDIAAHSACIEDRIAENQPAAACLHAAHSDCLGLDPTQQTAQATLCFRNAKDRWAAGIRDELAELGGRANETVAAIAAIEARYDTLANLLQCDRMEELARLTDATSADIELQKARCEATALGLALTKLILQARAVP